MSKLAAHTALIDRLNTVTTPAALATVLADITHLDQPGFPNDLPDGDYFDGYFFATVKAGKLHVTQVYQLAPKVMTLWGELDAQQRAANDDARIEREVQRGRGRPEEGEPVLTRIPAWLLRLVDTYAAEHGVSRAAAVRALLATGHRAATQTTAH